MPTYSFKNIETNEEFERILSMSERETYLEENPHIKQTITVAPSLGDSVRLGLRRPDNGFREVLQKAKVHKHNTINDF